MLAEKLGNLTLGSNPSVATYAKRDGVHVRVAAKADSDEAAKALAKDVVEELESLLEPVIWGYDNDELAQLIMDSLSKQGLTLATLESFTGGFLSHVLSSVSSSVTAYRGSVLAYNMQAQAAFDLMNTNLTPGEEMTLVFADALKERFNADIGLAVAELVRDDAEKKTIFIAVKGKGIHASQSLDLPLVSRDWLKERASYVALSLLWSELKEAQLSA